MNSKQSTGMGTNGQERDQNEPMTENSISNSVLKPVQRRAIERLAAGGRVGDVARGVGVHRNTIRRWLGEQDFLRELQCVDGQMRQVARSRVFAMADSAANTIEYAIAKGDARLALQLLKSIDVFGYDRLRGEQASGADLDLVMRLDAERFVEDDADVGDVNGLDRMNGIDRNGSERREEGSDRIDRMEGSDTIDGNDAIDANESKSVAGLGLTEAGDCATDDPGRYNSPVFGNLGPEGRDRDFVRMSAPAGGPAAVPSLAFALRCIAAWFSLHCLALFCTMRAFFAGILPNCSGGTTVSGAVAGDARSAAANATIRRTCRPHRGETFAHRWLSLLAQLDPFRRDSSFGVPVGI